MKSVVKIALGICLGFVLLVGGCAALVGGAMSGSDSDDGTAASRAAEDRKDRKADTKAAESTKVEETAAEEPAMSVGQENAVSKAETYLDYMGFSRSGLIKQLKFDKFSEKDAAFAVDYLKPNWNEQAALKAETYLDSMGFSRDGLIDQLKFDGFTAEQAAYGAKQAGL